MVSPLLVVMPLISGDPNDGFLFLNVPCLAIRLHGLQYQHNMLQHATSCGPHSLWESNRPSPRQGQSVNPYVLYETETPPKKNRI